MNRGNEVNETSVVERRDRPERSASGVEERQRPVPADDYAILLGIKVIYS